MTPALTVSRMRLCLAALSDLRHALPAPVHLLTADFDRSVHLGTSILRENYSAPSHFLAAPVIVKSLKTDGSRRLSPKRRGPLWSLVSYAAALCR